MVRADSTASRNAPSVSMTGRDAPARTAIATAERARSVLLPATIRPGVVGWAKSLARELGSRNVRANVVAPGYVKTQLTDVLPEEATELMLSNTPLGRLGDPEDVAGAVRYLCSDAAGFVTGVVLLVDGGLGM